MGRRVGDGGGPSEVVGRRPGPAHGAELAERVLLHWRVRCLLRQAPLRATTSADSLALCAAMLWTLEHREAPPGLLLTARRWAESAATVPDATRALECLAEVVAEIAEVAFPAFSRRSLPELFARLAGEARSAVTRRARRPGVDVVTGLPDRPSLERDLDALVAAAKVGGGVDVTVAVVEPQRSARGSVRTPRRHPVAAEQGALRDLAAALEDRLAGGARLYRLGTRRLAVVAARWDTRAMGELMLRASCSAAASFVWGTASLRGAGERAAADPDALVVLAEADLHLRRRDLLRARAALARQHRRTALRTVAAALVVLAGAALGVGTSGPGAPPSRSASAPPPSTLAPGGTGGAPAAGPPAPSPAPSSPAPAAVASVPAASGGAPSGGAGTAQLVGSFQPEGGGQQGTGAPAPPGAAPPPPGQPSPSPPPSSPSPRPRPPVPATSPAGQVLASVLGKLGGLRGPVAARKAA